jgi:hypothetical protein
MRSVRDADGRLHRRGLAACKSSSAPPPTRTNVPRSSPIARPTESRALAATLFGVGAAGRPEGEPARDSG